MSEFTFEQLSVSTAEDENNYFTGQQEVALQPNPNSILPPGTYRVIEGSLYRVMRGAPLALPAAGSERGGAENTLPDQQ
jgi:hypothetical protein